MSFIIQHNLKQTKRCLNLTKFSKFHFPTIQVNFDIICIIIIKKKAKMLRRLFRQTLTYASQKSKRFPVDNQTHEYFKDANLSIDEKLLTKIDLSKIGIDYMPDTKQLENVPELKHGLDKFLNGELVMGNYGVGNLPSLDQNQNSAIRQVTSYTDPSSDKNLHQTGKLKQCRYMSSTSNISGPLICLYYIFSSFRSPQLDNIYSSWLNKPSNWIISMRKPTSFYLHKINQNCDSISSDKGVLPLQHEVLLNLGHLVEYLLTHEKQQTAKLLSGQKVPLLKNYYRYVNVNKEITLRSQIDCKSYDKNGNPYVFEIKSRACAPIRYDVQNYVKYLDYEIISKRGEVQSFQREYYDLIRSGFLKYAMQVKIGKMNGAFIAYHNTEKIYGYQYVDLKEMALRVFGDQYNLDVSFLCVSKMLTIVLDHIRKSLPEHKNDSLKIGFYSEFKYRKLVVFVEGMSKTKQYIPLPKQNKQIKTVIDYYTKYTKLENPIYKYEFDFLIYVNGFHVENPQILLTPHDNVEIKYKVTEKMPISQEEYIIFLSQAYKDQEVFSSHLYRGVWNIADNPID